MWRVYRYELQRHWGPLPDLVAGLVPDLDSWVAANGGREGVRFLLGPDGFPDLRVNAFFASAKMRNRSELTNRDYARGVCLWLNFLTVHGRHWWEACEDDVEEFQFWRMTDPANAGRVQATTFSKDLAACKKFHKWAATRYQVTDPFADAEPPRAKRHASVKWLDPAGFARWRDLGLRGYDLTAAADPAWKGRNEQRNAAFADGLLGTGLRLSEWASVIVPELPQNTAGRAYFTCRLADSCGKGGYGHKYWMPRNILTATLAYIEGARARAIRRAQAAGRYDTILARQIVTVDTTRGGSVRSTDRTVQANRTAFNDLGPAARRRLFVETGHGIAPLSLWLNEDGLPRDAHGWHHTFTDANERIHAMGLGGFTCSPHMARHSFALRWYSIGKLATAGRLHDLTEDEARDFREQFGDTWHLVQTMLGHRSVETTKNVYLEPFRSLDVELLLAHAEGFPISKFMAEVFASHPRVRTDPLAVNR